MLNKNKTNKKKGKLVWYETEIHNSAHVIQTDLWKKKVRKLQLRDFWEDEFVWWSVEKVKSERKRAGMLESSEIHWSDETTTSD